MRSFTEAYGHFVVLFYNVGYSRYPIVTSAHSETRHKLNYFFVATSMVSEEILVSETLLT